MYRIRKTFPIFLALLILLCTCLPGTALAAGNGGDRQYYLGTAVNAGKDTGYSERNAIGQRDPHFGWTLGRFFVTGYTSETTDDTGNPVFLKTVGDKVTLWFNLEQDIDKLNGDEDLSICRDSNGYDEYFGISKTDFGRGTLIIRYTDYRNLTQDPMVYTDYLSANLTPGVDTQVELFEEGDYEVALNYEIKDTALDVFGLTSIPTYTNYRIFFRFSVRNGNCMVFPFDAVTGAELTNTAITENGFYLDLAKSRYLDVQIKKEVLAEGADGLTEDVRFNRPAREGDRYTEEGIYTITVRNHYTNQETTKVIYVGTNDVLKAHVTTGLPISEIALQLTSGATVAEDGTLIPAATEPPATTEPPAESTEAATIPSVSTTPTVPAVGSLEPPAEETFPTIWLWVGFAAAGVLLLLYLIYRYYHPRVKAR